MDNLRGLAKRWLVLIVIIIIIVIVCGLSAMRWYNAKAEPNLPYGIPYITVFTDGDIEVECWNCGVDIQGLVGLIQVQENPSTGEIRSWTVGWYGTFCNPSGTICIDKWMGGFYPPNKCGAYQAISGIIGVQYPVQGFPKYRVGQCLPLVMTNGYSQQDQQAYPGPALQQEIITKKPKTRSPYPAP